MQPHATRTHARTHTHTHTHTQPFNGLLSSTRRNIHPLTPILIINHPLSTSSTMIHSILLVQFTCKAVLFRNLSPGNLSSTSWPEALCFVLHTFLHPINIFFSRHMPIQLQPVLLSYRDHVIKVIYSESNAAKVLRISIVHSKQVCIQIHWCKMTYVLNYTTLVHDSCQNLIHST